jgi:predicted N-acetyltransferase YhbS
VVRLMFVCRPSALSLCPAPSLHAPPSRFFSSRQLTVKMPVLKFLHTDPKHWKRGAGSLLIRWGLDKSRELQLPAYLEASPKGAGLYLKHGFKVFDQLDFDLARWGGEGVSSVALMLRPWDS